MKNKLKLVEIVFLSFCAVVAGYLVLYLISSSDDYYNEEVSPLSYHVIHSWKEDYPTMRPHIAKAIEDDVITRREYHDLINLVDQNPIRIQEEKEKKEAARALLKD